MREIFDETIHEFGRSLGMGDLRLRENGALMLQVDNIGTIAFELIGEFREQVAMSLTRQIEPPDAEACRRILELCHYRNPAPFPVHPAFNSHGSLVFAIGFSAADFTLPNINQAIDTLDGLHQQIQSSVRLVHA
jgi:type III secretion system chaperone SycN